MIHGIQIIVEFFSQIFYKSQLHIFSRSAVIFRLIIHLKTNDTFPVSTDLHQFPDHSLRIKKIHRIGDIHDLSRTIDTDSVFRSSNHIRMSLHHPCRHCISRRSDDHVDSGFLHSIHHTLHMRKIKHPILWLAGAPRRLRNTHRIDPRFFHHLYIFIKSVIRHVFVIVSRTKNNFSHLCLPLYILIILS